MPAQSPTIPFFPCLIAPLSLEISLTFSQERGEQLDRGPKKRWSNSGSCRGLILFLWQHLRERGSELWGRTRADDFRKNAVRIVRNGGIVHKQVAGDSGVGMSTLNRWISTRRDTDVVTKEDLDCPGRMTSFGVRPVLSEYLKGLSPAPARLCAVETACAITASQKQLPIA